MRINWLYFAVRSDRLSEPVLIWPQFVATAMSAMVETEDSTAYAVVRVGDDRLEIDGRGRQPDQVLEFGAPDTP